MQAMRGWTLCLLLCISSQAVGDEVGRVDFNSNATFVDGKILDATRRHTISWIRNRKRGGFIVSSNALPSAGKLLIFGKDGGVNACSGVLLDGGNFLTAAHCVCTPTMWKDKPSTQSYASSCAMSASAQTYKVLFPGIGLYRLASNPIIHQDYYPPTLPIKHGQTSVADLAILKLEDRPPIIPTPLKAFKPGNHHIVVSYGTHSFSVVPEDSGYIIDTPYYDGPQQISKQLAGALQEDWNDCGVSNAATDAICSAVNSLPGGGRTADAGACVGDSGGPLLELDDEGAFHVVGVTSYTFPLPGEQPCDSTRGAYTFFIKLSAYHDWILQQVDAAPHVSVNPECRGVLLRGPGRFQFDVVEGGFSVSSFGPVAKDSRTDRPPVEIAPSDGFECQHEQSFGIHSCIVKVPAKADLVINAGYYKSMGALVQITLCEWGGKS